METGSPGKTGRDVKRYDPIASETGDLPAYGRVEYAVAAVRTCGAGQLVAPIAGSATKNMAGPLSVVKGGDITGVSKKF